MSDEPKVEAEQTASDQGSVAPPALAVVPTGEAEVAAPAKKKHYKMMTGTDGTPDYLIVAQNHQVALGLKVMLQAIPDKDGSCMGTLCILRLRAAALYAPNEVIELEVDEEDQAVEVDLSSAFPGFKWEQKDAKRFSLNRGIMIPRAPWQVEQLKAAMNEMGIKQKVIALLAEGCDKELFTLQPDEVTTWLDATVNKVLNKINSKSLGAAIDKDAQFAPMQELAMKLRGKPSAKAKLLSKGMKVVGGTEEPPVVQSDDAAQATITPLQNMKKLFNVVGGTEAAPAEAPKEIIDELLSGAGSITEDETGGDTYQAASDEDEEQDDED